MGVRQLPVACVIELDNLVDGLWLELETWIGVRRLSEISVSFRPILGGLATSRTAGPLRKAHLELAAKFKESIKVHGRRIAIAGDSLEILGDVERGIAANPCRGLADRAGQPRVSARRLAARRSGLTRSHDRPKKDDHHAARSQYEVLPDSPCGLGLVHLKNPRMGRTVPVLSHSVWRGAEEGRSDFRPIKVSKASF